MFPFFLHIRLLALAVDDEQIQFHKSLPSCLSFPSPLLFLGFDNVGSIQQDLTQSVWGFSRDDAIKFIGRYSEQVCVFFCA